MDQGRYRFAIAWLSVNDDYPHTDSEVEYEDSTSVKLVADMFQTNARMVAREVLKARASFVAETVPA